MPHRRQFTAAFKAHVVLAWLTGAQSRAKCCREHQLAASGLADGKASVLARLAASVEHVAPRTNHASARTAAVERLVGRLTLAHERFKKATTILPHHAQRARAIVPRRSQPYPLRQLCRGLRCPRRGHEDPARRRDATGRKAAIPGPCGWRSPRGPFAAGICAGTSPSRARCPPRALPASPRQ